MIHCHLRSQKPQPDLHLLVAKQKSEGGHLILYRRFWSFVAVTVSQDHVEHVPTGASRALAGISHTLYTLILGVWSPGGLVGFPLIAILNLRGGLDVTAFYSDHATAAFQIVPPDPNQAKRDLLISQVTFIVLGLAIVATVFVFFVESPFPK